MRLLLPILVLFFLTSNSFASTILRTQNDILARYQSKLQNTLEAILALEKDETQKIIMIQDSDDFKKCVEDDKACARSKQDLKNRSKFFASQFAAIWGNAIGEMDKMNDELRKSPGRRQNFLETEKLTYFVQQYKLVWATRTRAINDEFNLLLKAACSDQRDSCLVQGNADLLLQKHQLLMEVDQKAIESLKTGTGEFFPDSTEI